MRILLASLSLFMVGFGVVLFALLLYDATEVARALGLEPSGNEAIVVIVGSVVASVTAGLGARALLRPSVGSASANAS